MTANWRNHPGIEILRLCIRYSKRYADEYRYIADVSAQASRAKRWKSPSQNSRLWLVRGVCWRHTTGGRKNEHFVFAKC